MHRYSIVRCIVAPTQFTQAHPQGFEKGDSSVHNQPGICGKISENVSVKHNSFKTGIRSNSKTGRGRGRAENEDGSRTRTGRERGRAEDEDMPRTRTGRERRLVEDEDGPRTRTGRERGRAEEEDGPRTKTCRGRGRTEDEDEDGHDRSSGLCIHKTHLCSLCRVTRW